MVTLNDMQRSRRILHKQTPTSPPSSPPSPPPPLTTHHHQRHHQYHHHHHHHNNNNKTQTQANANLLLQPDSLIVTTRDSHQGSKVGHIDQGTKVVQPCDLQRPAKKTRNNTIIIIIIIITIIIINNNSNQQQSTTINNNQQQLNRRCTRRDSVVRPSTCGACG